MKFQIRVAVIQDLDAILTLFRNCVLSVCRHDYDDEQLNAWVLSADNKTLWSNKIKNDHFIVAITNETIVGFASLEGHDTIDLLYVHPNFQRSGVASSLLEALVKKAEKLKANVLRAEVSKTAKAFFECKGFKVIITQSKVTSGVVLENFQMSKALVKIKSMK
jgi:putative acetyltransferase